MLPRSPRALALWAGALVVALATATLVAGDLAALHRRATQLGPEGQVVVADHDLPLGAVVSRSDVSVRRIHRSQRPSDTIGSLRTAVGRTVAAPVLRGTFVARRNLAPEQRTGLDGVVPQGMRALRIVTTDALRPHPGASVDVLATFDDARSGPADHQHAVSTVVARGVLVVATDRDSTGGGGSRAGVAGVTLLVDEPQAARLAYASATGVVTLALTPPEDATRSP